MDNCSDKLSIIQRRGLPQLKINLIFSNKNKVQNNINLKIKKKPRLT